MQHAVVARTEIREPGTGLGVALAGVDAEPVTVDGAVLVVVDGVLAAAVTVRLVE